MGQAISSTLDLETRLTTIVSRAVQLTGLDGGVVFDNDETAEEFIQRAAAETGGISRKLVGAFDTRRAKGRPDGRPSP